MDSSRTIEVMYSCGQCRLKKAKVSIRARGKDEDIKAWMDSACIIGIANDHRRRSPRCRAQAIDEVFIPLPAGAQQPIGTTTEH